MEVYKRIRALRKLKGYSQAFMAKKMGVSQRAFSMIELNETALNWKKLNQIAAILNLGVWELVNTNTTSNTENIAIQNVNLLQELIKQYEARIEALEKEVSELKQERI